MKPKICSERRPSELLDLQNLLRPLGGGREMKRAAGKQQHIVELGIGSAGRRSRSEHL